MIQGLYIDRRRNGRRENFFIDPVNSSNDKVIFIREQKEEDGGEEGSEQVLNLASQAKEKHESHFEKLKREKMF